MKPNQARALLFLTVAFMTRSALTAPPAAPPDLTQSKVVDRKQTYNLGATGLRGWIDAKPASYLDSVQALGPDILAAVKTRCPADTMFGNEIRMGALKASTKYHFREGIEAGVVFAKTQGGHGSESRTGVIMKEIMTYGSAAREALPGLKELIFSQNEQCQKGEFPAGELNNRRVTAVEEVIKFIEAATSQPELHSIVSLQL